MPSCSEIELRHFQQFFKCGLDEAAFENETHLPIGCDRFVYERPRSYCRSCCRQEPNSHAVRTYVQQYFGFIHHLLIQSLERKHSTP